MVVDALTVTSGSGGWRVGHWLASSYPWLLFEGKKKKGASAVTKLKFV